VLAVNNVYKTFNSGTVNEKTALNNISLHLDAGEFVTLIGGNGSGKSTLLNCIAGVHAVDKGSIIIDGVDVTRQPEHVRAKDLGRVFQDPMLGTAADMQIEENLALAYRRGKRRSLRWGITAKERRFYRDLLGTLELGLEDRLSLKVGMLSGGQRQALALLMATLKEPKLLLLDEHTAALDPKTAVKVLEITEKIVMENKLTTLMVTHNMRDAIRYGNRLIMMHEGRILLDIEGEAKKKLTVEELLSRFGQASSGEEFTQDSVLLS
jgi:putative ABC transport system ATP-binding protein